MHTHIHTHMQYNRGLIPIMRIIGITGETLPVYVASTYRPPKRAFPNFRWLPRELTENKARSDFGKTSVQVP